MASRDDRSHCPLQDPIRAHDRHSPAYEAGSVLHKVGHLTRWLGEPEVGLKGCGVGRRRGGLLGDSPLWLSTDGQAPGSFGSRASKSWPLVPCGRTFESLGLTLAGGAQNAEMEPAERSCRLKVRSTAPWPRRRAANAARRASTGSSTSELNAGAATPTLHARSSACTTISISRTTRKSSVGSAQSCHGTYVVGPAASIAAPRCSRDRVSTSIDSVRPAEPSG